MTKHELMAAARKALQRRQFEKVLKLLEPKVPLYANDADFFYLLGTACYYKGDLSGAELYFNRGLACNRDDTTINLMLAVIALRKRDTAMAIRRWFNILELDPDNKAALYAIRRLKDIETHADLSRFILSPELKKLLPKVRFGLPVKAKKIISLTLLVVLVCGLTALTSRLVGNTEKRSSTLTENLPPNAYQNADNGLYPPSSVYTMTPKELNDTYEKALKLFDSYKDNAARVLLNTLRHSNADAQLKHRAYRVQNALRVPDFTSPPDGDIRLKEVLENPLLYEGCYVIWRGMLKDLFIDEQNNRIAFKLLIGYEDKKLLEGEIPVYLYFNVFIESTLPTEVLGQVLLDKTGQPYLKGLSVHQIVR
jgi:tetratricopeptide (TPR) repeat protein